MHKGRKPFPPTSGTMQKKFSVNSRFKTAVICCEGLDFKAGLIEIQVQLNAMRQLIRVGSTKGICLKFALFVII